MTTKVINRRTRAIYDIYVGRPSPWGNPFAVMRGRKGPINDQQTLAEVYVKTLSEALRKYEEWLLEAPGRIAKVRDLRGKTLACWCVNDLTGKEPIICHAQILARVADGACLPVVKRMADVIHLPFRGK